ncbi:hypothetical protein [Streptomyces sp. NRRL F-5123]|uniref:hypothetical protein n=1 Tax=Streptomyces sp. NRRL F-5123 TaxID=1463856 RepID=UPI0004E146C3|nr:hypothetical protein [Streptomyces sp. NRRL F-5123]
MLVGLYRDGALRQRIRKGYVIAGEDPAEVLRPLLGRALTPERQAPVVRGEAQPAEAGRVWLDSGTVSLSTPAARARIARSLADATAALAVAVRRRGGVLLPSGYAPGGPPTSAWLTSDEHDVEVYSDVQRELCTNLFRQHSAALIALTGRSAYGPHTAGGQGSRRLAETTDQLTTRYLHSAAPAHLERVTASLSRDEGVTRLDLMDVDPLGGSDGAFPAVTLRMIDAQILVADTMAHALLVQALAIRARRFEREGRRVPALLQQIVDRNRSRAVAHGLAASFDVESGAANRQGRGGAGPGRGGPRTAADRPKTRPQARVHKAHRVCLDLLKDLTPEFQAMDVGFAEVAPLLAGLALQDSHPLAARNENDLVASWRRAAPAELDDQHVAGRLADAGWLLTDHVTAQVRSLAPGSTSLLALEWEQPLAWNTPAQHARRDRPRDRRDTDDPTGPPATHRPGQPSQRRATAPRTAAALLTALEQAGNPSGAASLAVVREHLAGGGGGDLDRELRNHAQAREIRRSLRPPRRQTVTAGEARFTWDSEAAVQAVTLARRHGAALLACDVPVSDKLDLNASVRRCAQHRPEGLAVLTLASTVYRSERGQRAKSELLLVDLAGSSAVPDGADDERPADDESPASRKPPSNPEEPGNHDMPVGEEATR